MKPLKVKVSITLDDDLVEELRSLAEQDERSLSQYINLMLRSSLSQKDALDGREKE